jgi:nucleotide-binding universal stress UspA family protein
MKLNKLILAAHDFSPSSKNAIKIAADIAFQTNSKLFLYHVVSTSAFLEAEAMYIYNPDDDIKKASAWMRRAISYLKKNRPGLQIAFEIDYGFLMPVLMDKIQSMSPWLTVVGVKKRKGLDKVIFGDVCTTLAGKVRSPLLVVPANAKSFDVNLVAYGWDGKTAEVHQLNPIKELIGSKSNVQIKAVNVSHYDQDVEQNKSLFLGLLKKMFPNQLTGIHQILGLDKEHEFEKAIQSMKPDVLVIYARHYNIWQSVFHKRFSKYAIKFTQIPVMIVSQ